MKAYVYKDGRFVFRDVSRPSFCPVSSCGTGAENEIYIIPGLVDVHVHLREPGFSYKETIKTGTAAAKAGGYRAVCSMPNLNPVPDSLENLKVQLDIIGHDAAVRVLPFGAVTVGEKGERLSDMEAMAPYVAGFSDDGRGVQSDALMREAMVTAKALGKVISAHCEVNSLLGGGYIHDGQYARERGHRGISSESEWRMIERDVSLAAETGCAYHVCHISTKEGVGIIRQAKKSGVDITCETAPHYLVLCDGDLREDGRFKMNPPLRSAQDRDALIEGILDGTVDMIATDHAPHSAEEKSRGLEKSLMGVVGLECAFAVMYTELVRTGIIPLEKLISLMSINPAARFSIPDDGKRAVFRIGSGYTVEPERFLSKGRSTPFEGREVFARCLGMLDEDPS